MCEEPPEGDKCGGNDGGGDQLQRPPPGAHPDVFEPERDTLSQLDAVAVLQLVVADGVAIDADAVLAVEVRDTPARAVERELRTAGGQVAGLEAEVVRRPATERIPGLQQRHFVSVIKDQSGGQVDPAAEYRSRAIDQLTRGTAAPLRRRL